MRVVFDAVFEFLLKYPPRVFERGTLVWQQGGGMRLLLPAALILSAVALTYVTARGRTRPADRVVLGVIRLGALALLTACLMRPALLVSSAVPQRNILAVLLDDSRSMSIADAGRITRIAAVQAAFADSADVVRSLGEKFALRFYRFGSGLDRVGGAARLRGNGARTDLALALDEARRDLAGLPVAGIVLVTDGADNGAGALAEPLLALRGRKVPVYPVGVGSERFSSDIAIERVDLPSSALRGATLVATVTLRQRGMGGKSVTVTAEDGGRQVAVQEVSIPRDGDLVTVHLRLPGTEPGPRRIRIAVRPVPGEAVEQNNQTATVLQIRDRREKVLYLEGEPRPEFPFLRRAAASDSNLQLVGMLRTAEGKFLRLGVDDSLELAGGIPTSRVDLFRYRAIIVGSFEASAFTLDQLRMLADFVGERGGGLLALGGRHSFGEGGWTGSPLEEVLPLRFSGRPGEDTLRPPAELQVRPTPAGLSHVAMQLGGTAEEGRKRWDSLPPLTLVNRIDDARPGATVLLDGSGSERGSRTPLLAAQRYGRGRAAAFAPQDSWLWQMHAAVPLEDLSHETFWRQMLRWLVEETPDRLEVTASPARPGPGQAITVRAELWDSAYSGVNDAAVRGTVTAPSGVERSIGLDWILGQHGAYRGVFTAAEEGLYRIDIESARGGDSLRADPSWVWVADQGADFVDAELRTPFLRRIAEETGGRYYPLNAIGSLPEDVVYTESGITVTEAKELWDAPLVFFLLLGLLAAEWSFRRSRGLA